MKTPSKQQKPEPAPITMDDIARKFLNTKPKSNNPIEPQKTKPTKGK
jgi:hypothetical protein